MSDVTASVMAAIDAHHVLEFHYTDRHGVRLVLEGEPYAYRTSTAGNRVLWIYNEARGKYEELVAERIASVRDTGRGFEKRSDWRTVIGD